MLRVFADFRFVPLIRGLRPYGLAFLPLAHLTQPWVMVSSMQNMLNSFLCKKSRTDEFDEFVMLQILNSMRENSIEVSNNMSSQPIDPINAQNFGLISLMELVRDASLGVAIEGCSDILHPNSNGTTSIGGHKNMGTLPIEIIEDHLSPNFILPR